MASKKYLIYSGVAPTIPKEVTALERKEYLKCKFWKASHQDAWKFFYCYFPPSTNPSLCRLLLILSGRLFQKKGFDEACKEAWKLNEQKLNHRLDIDLVLTPRYKKIIEALQKPSISSSYPKNGFLEDIIIWAKNNRVITDKQSDLLFINIQLVRGANLDSRYLSNDVLISTIKILLESRFLSSLSYEDAQALLFPRQELLNQLVAISDLPRYFEIRYLMKQLMQKNHLSEQLTESFKELKVESIKENIAFSHDIRFDSIAKLVRQGADRDELLQEALQNKPLYWKYPTSCKCKNRCICKDGVRWVENTTSLKHSIIEEKRLRGFGQLKKTKPDDAFQCSIGGVTIEMLRHSELPITNINHYRIELVPTQDEISYGLQPYIIVEQGELMPAVADDRIGFLVNRPNIEQPEKQNLLTQQLISTIVERNSNLSAHSQIENDFLTQNKYDKKNENLYQNKQPNRIRLLIQQYWRDLESKTAEFIWKKMREERECYGWICEDFPYWTEGRQAHLRWEDRKRDRSLSIAAFSTYISQLAQGKIPLYEDEYKFIYDDYPQ